MAIKTNANQLNLLNENGIYNDPLSDIVEGVLPFNLSYKEAILSIAALTTELSNAAVKTLFANSSDDYRRKAISNLIKRGLLRNFSEPLYKEDTHTTHSVMITKDGLELIKAKFSKRFINTPPIHLLHGQPRRARLQTSEIYALMFVSGVNIFSDVKPPMFMENEKLVLYDTSKNYFYESIEVKSQKGEATTFKGSRIKGILLGCSRLMPVYNMSGGLNRISDKVETRMTIHISNDKFNKKNDFYYYKRENKQPLKTALAVAGDNIADIATQLIIMKVPAAKGFMTIYDEIILVPQGLLGIKSLVTSLYPDALSYYVNTCKSDTKFENRTYLEYDGETLANHKYGTGHKVLFLIELNMHKLRSFLFYLDRTKSSGVIVCFEEYKGILQEIIKNYNEEKNGSIECKYDTFESDNAEQFAREMYMLEKKELESCLEKA